MIRDLFLLCVFQLYSAFHLPIEAEDCSEIACSNIIDYVCGVAEIGGFKKTKTYQNICYLNRDRCKTKPYINVHQVPDWWCNIEKSGRRVHDFSIMGAHQACNHSCPTYCVDTYEPACAKIWTSPTKFKYRPMVNHCHIDLLSCAAGVNVTIDPLVRCYKNPSELLFMMQAVALKSLRLISDVTHNRRTIKEWWTPKNRLNKMYHKFLRMAAFDDKSDSDLEI